MAIFFLRKHRCKRRKLLASHGRLKMLVFCYRTETEMNSFPFGSKPLLEKCLVNRSWQNHLWVTCEAWEKALQLLPFVSQDALWDPGCCEREGAAPPKHAKWRGKAPQVAGPDEPRSSATISRCLALSRLSQQRNHQLNSAGAHGAGIPLDWVLHKVLTLQWIWL